MHRKRGFTLIELLVVIAIIGILSSVVLASLNSARQKSRDAKRVSDIQNLQLALELSFDSNSEYPDSLLDLSPNFIPSDPIDPLTGSAYLYDNLTSTGVACVIASGDCVMYHLGADLEGSGSNVLDTDADVCVSAATGCARVLTGTTLNGVDGGGATANDCVGAGVGVYCYDVTP